MTEARRLRRSALQPRPHRSRGGQAFQIVADWRHGLQGRPVDTMCHGKEQGAHLGHRGQTR